MTLFSRKVHGDNLFGYNTGRPVLLPDEVSKNYGLRV